MPSGPTTGRMEQRRPRRPDRRSIKRRGKRRPAFHHQPGDAARGQKLEHRHKIEAAGAVAATRSTSTPCGRKARFGVARRRRCRQQPRPASRARCGPAASPAAAAARCRARCAPANSRPCPAAGRSACGSSASTVPMPTMMASLCARMRWTRSRAASPVIATGRRPGGAGFAVGGDRKLEHAHAGGRRACGGCGRHDRAAPPRRRRRRRPRCRRRAAGRGPAPATSGLGSSIAETTRAMPAAITASAQGGDLPKCEQGSSVT